MKNFLLLLIASTLFFSCQKEEAVLTPADDVALKSVDASTYKKVTNGIAKKAEYESYCNTDYYYSESIYLDGVEWQYPTTGYEYLMYEGLARTTTSTNDYMFNALEFPTNGYVYGIGFGNRSSSADMFPFTASVKICVPEKNYSISYANAKCFAIGNSAFASYDSIRIVLHKKQTKDLTVAVDSVLTFEQLKNKLGTARMVTDSVSLYSSIGNVGKYTAADVYNWDYYNGGTTDIYGLENAGTLTNNLNFGDGLIGDCSGTIDIYLHEGKIIYKCSTSYSIFYQQYQGCRKQLHIYTSASSSSSTM